MSSNNIILSQLPNDIYADGDEPTRELILSGNPFTFTTGIPYSYGEITIFSTGYTWNIDSKPVRKYKKFHR